MASRIYLTADTHNETALRQILEEDDLLVVLPELMTEGPLKDPEGILSFDDLRRSFKKSIQTSSQSHIEIEDKGNVATIMEVSQLLSNQKYSELYYWMSGNVTDLCAYFFVLHFLRSHYELIYTINTAGLPFLDDDMKLFFPKRIGDLNKSQLEKALRLTKNISASEMEIDGEEWKILREQEGMIRIADGNKKLKTVAEDYFDTEIKAAHKEGNKLQRTLNSILKKAELELSPEFIEYRLNSLYSASDKTSSTSEE